MCSIDKNSNENVHASFQNSTKLIKFDENFSLPERKSPLILETINSHELDKYLSFEEKEHVYTFNGKRMKNSVTQFVERFFSKFDAKKVIEQMRNGKNWPRGINILYICYVLYAYIHM